MAGAGSDRISDEATAAGAMKWVRPGPSVFARRDSEKFLERERENEVLLTNECDER